MSTHPEAVRLWRENPGIAHIDQNGRIIPRWFTEDRTEDGWVYRDEPYTALPTPAFEALLDEVESLRALNEKRLSEPRNVDDVCEALCEASCVDVSAEKCAAIWALMEGPATTLFSLAVVAWERGESHRSRLAERDAALAEVARLRAALDLAWEWMEHPDLKGVLVMASIYGAKVGECSRAVFSQAKAARAALRPAGAKEAPRA